MKIIGEARPGGHLIRLLMNGVMPNALIITAVIVIVLIATSIGFARLVTMPRADLLSSLIANQILIARSALASMSPADRDQYLARLWALGEESMARGDPREVVFEQPDTEVGRYFLQRMRERLPGTEVHYSLRPSPQLWLTLAHGEDLWLRIPMQRFATIPAVAWAGWISGVALLAMLVSYFMLLHFRRKLATLDRAIDDLADSQTQDDPTPPRLQASDDLDHLAKRLEEVSSRLAEANGERKLMLAGVSHDLRALLTKLRISLALDRGPGDLTPSDYLAQIDRFVAQFLDFSRKPEDEPIVNMDLNDVVREVCANAQADGRNVDLKLAELPRMNIGPLPLVRMVSNLLDNALHYGEEPVEVETCSDGAHVSIRVMDRGLGVSYQDLAQLATPFFRGGNAQGRAGGSGLGLAIVTQIAQASGGELILRSPDGGGFVAEVRLPLLAMDAPALSTDSTDSTESGFIAARKYL